MEEIADTKKMICWGCMREIDANGFVERDVMIPVKDYSTNTFIMKIFTKPFCVTYCVDKGF